MNVSTIARKLAGAKSDETFAHTLVAFYTRPATAISFRANIIYVYISTFGLELAVASLEISANVGRPCHFCSSEVSFG